MQPHNTMPPTSPDPSARKQLQRQKEREYNAQYRTRTNAARNADNARYRLDHPDYYTDYYASHREQLRGRVGAWRRANPDKAKAIRARHRALKAGALCERVDYAAIRKRDKGICGICGKAVTRAEQSFDHILPVSCGGSHTMWNIQLAHMRCNSRKKDGRLPSQLRLPF